MAAAKNSTWIWIKPDSDLSRPTAEALASELTKKGHTVKIGGEPKGDETLAISIGGDGTFLSMLRRLGDKRFSTEVLGIHGSRGIGFLTTCKTHQENSDRDRWAQYLAGKIIARDGVFRKHYGLTGEIVQGSQVKSKLWALNDVVIGRTALSRMLSLTLRRNDEVIYEKLKGDGIVFSSALGSTAYALSAGGPVVDPYLQVILMTPICAHPAPQPPMLFSVGGSLSAESLDASMKAMITLDGQEGIEFHKDETIRLSVTEKPISFFAPHVEEKYSCGGYFQSLARLGIGGAHVSGS